MCRKFLMCAECTLNQIMQCESTMVFQGARVLLLQDYIAHAHRQNDQDTRRLLQGENIAHDEKAFSIFEPHTRWIAKGKAGVSQELSVPA